MMGVPSAQMKSPILKQLVGIVGLAVFVAAIALLIT